MRLGLFFAAAILSFALADRSALAAECTANDFAEAVDQSAASLRALTLDAQPKIQERLRRYKAANSVGSESSEEAAFEAARDATLDELDKKSADLLLRVDSLGRIAEGETPDCAKLEQVKAAAAELNKVIKTKTDYMLRRLDEKIAEAQAQPEPAKPAPATAPPTVADKPAKLPAPPSKHADVTPPVEKRIPSPVPAAPSSPPPASAPWTADTKADDAYKGPSVAMREQGGGSMPIQEDGYSIDEIRNATRGFFGTISTNLAGVIEHAFKEMGRPTAYVLGTEGGGAFFAGLRFGKGTLYMRHERDVRDVYWHGPSVGTDFGASGSRTLFLIYRLKSSDELYRNFTGIDGSAYFVGGVGLTLLKGGAVIMAPIRSGVGVRLGANLGYVRFTPQPTWNPF